MTINNCPFCDSDDVTLVSDGFAEFVVCGECSANGPTANGESLAIEAWNRASRDWLRAQPEADALLPVGWEQRNSINFGVYHPKPEPMPRLIFDGLPEGATVRMERVGGGPITIAIGAQR